MKSRLGRDRCEPKPKKTWSPHARPYAAFARLFRLSLLPAPGGSSVSVGTGHVAANGIRFAVGDEDPFDLIRHLVYAARGTLDMDLSNFSAGFMDVAAARELVRQNYAEAHAKFVDVELQDCPGY